ncbi:MAG: alpha/beta hydrolase [Nitrospira sp.]|nr:alpha/beta hydrolase [Nitrospira sp.]
MNLDIVLHRGSIDKPAIIFIHGLGMDKDIWVNPSQSRILGGMYPLKALLSKKHPHTEYEGDSPDSNPPLPPFSKGGMGGLLVRKSGTVLDDTLQSLFDDLRLKGYTVITWSQQRPASPIYYVVSELKEVIKIANENKLTDAGMILIGHSRGGLIGRKYLMKEDKSVRGLITISTPHKGSSIAKLVSYLSPLAPVINPLFHEGDKGTFSFAMKRILNFLKSKALKELLPDSHFFKSLKDGPLDLVYYISAGGTDPTLFNIYNLSIPDIFEKVIPESLYPDEFKKGKGDGLVSAESSRIPWCNEHYDFDFNHAQILFDEGARETLVKAIERINEKK